MQHMDPVRECEGTPPWERAIFTALVAVHPHYKTITMATNSEIPSPHLGRPPLLNCNLFPSLSSRALFKENKTGHEFHRHAAPLCTASISIATRHPQSNGAAFLFRRHAQGVAAPWLAEIKCSRDPPFNSTACLLRPLRQLHVSFQVSAAISREIGHTSRAHAATGAR